MTNQDNSFKLTFNIHPNSQHNEELNIERLRNWNNYAGACVISKSEYEFPNAPHKKKIYTGISLNQKGELISDFFGILSDKFNSTQGHSMWIDDHSELFHIDRHFSNLKYNYPGMQGFLKHLMTNGFVADEGIPLDTKTYNFGFPQTQYESNNSIKINEIGNLALLVNWNFIFDNELLNIPQKYNSRIHISKNHKYNEVSLFEIKIGSITPLERTPVIETYKNLK